MLFRASKKRGRVPPLPVFRSGGSLVDVANRNTLYQSMEEPLMLVVDTSVLVHAADQDSPFHATCRNWLDGQRVRPDAWYTSLSILYEFLRVATHPRAMRRISSAWDFVAARLSSPGLSVRIATQRHADVAAQVFTELPHLAGHRLHDVHTAILMRAHGIHRVCTRNTDFHQFPLSRSSPPSTMTECVPAISIARRGRTNERPWSRTCESCFDGRISGLGESCTSTAGRIGLSGELVSDLNKRQARLGLSCYLIPQPSSSAPTT
jgi:uncharacterized protein